MGAEGPDICSLAERPAQTASDSDANMRATQVANMLRPNTAGVVRNSLAILLCALIIRIWSDAASPSTTPHVSPADQRNLEMGLGYLYADRTARGAGLGTWTRSAELLTPFC